jgi:predicted  nucleic acid-binding Zn ribbon protein
MSYCPKCGRELVDLDNHDHFHCEKCRAVFNIERIYEDRCWKIVVKEL